MSKETEEDAQLAALGHKAELNRNFSTLYALLFDLCWKKNVSDSASRRSMLGLAFAILNVCAGVARPAL